MIYRCPNCNGALEYNPVTDEMECAYCGGGYTMQEMDANNAKKDDYIVVDSVINFENTRGTEGADDSSDVYSGGSDIYAVDETMEFKIYTCTSCAAELAVNDTEVSTWCAYCGQPTVVYSRISREKKPRYIIPFKITQDQALSKVRQALGKGTLVPDGIKHFDIEKMRGIYIPYYLFDTYFYDKAKVWSNRGGSNNSTVAYFMEADCDFKNLTCDAAMRLEDETTQRLEPYNLEGMRDFDAAYLSGFYADMYDLTPKQMSDTVLKRCQSLFDEHYKLYFGDLQTSVKDRISEHEIKHADYALFPAWFLTFRYNNEPYTMLVNGQTGKVVGSVPVDKKKAGILFTAIAAPVSVFLCFIGTTITTSSGLPPQLYIIIFFFAFIFFYIGISSIYVCNKRAKLTKLVKTADFVAERQDRD